MAPPVTAVVVTFNSERVIGTCLTALPEGVKAIVVDNASADRTAGIAEAQGATVIRNSANLGYGKANNIGVKAADTEFVLICNPDVTVDADTIAALLSATESWPEAGIWAPRVFQPDGREYFRTASYLSPGSQAKDPPQGDVQVPMVQGSCFLMRRDLFLEMGGFDENIFLFYEDDDLCRRLNDAGRAIFYVHAATVSHELGGSSQPRPGLIYLSRFHQAWSKAYVARKYGMPSPALSMMLVNGFKYLGAFLSGKAPRKERYGGSFMGALAGWRGRSAWDHTLIR
jgi:GT2 family glycosyltransferase